MNERIKELALQAMVEKKNVPCKGIDGWTTLETVRQIDPEKFAELIVWECIKQAHSVGDLRGVNDDMTFGADTAALKISKYFGVVE